MGKLSEQQVKQEVQYAYPYHYIPQWDGHNFSQTQNLALGFEYLSYLHFVMGKAKQIGFKSLLDVGCGDGRFLYEISQRFSDYQLAGLDYSQRAIDFAKIIMRETKVECVCGNIRDQDLFKKKFDIITLIETLEHVKFDEVKPFLTGIDNYLKEDGSFIITVPSKNVDLNKKHYQHFDLNSLKDALSPIFTITDVNYLNHKYSKFIKKILSNKLFILNHKKILRWFFKYYMNHLLHTEAINCRRIAVVCKKSTQYVQKNDLQNSFGVRGE
jgi:2-polyprenyl-3-methyl-5-hydroxy-6-metoxy-1,4-benzoquinol methylase